MTAELSTKETVLKLISEAPGDSTIDDIMYLLYMQQKVNNGLNDFQIENTYTQQQVELEIEEWLK